MKYMRSLLTLQPGGNDWIGGLRLAVAFAVPVAFSLMFAAPEIGLLVAIGAFFTANADLGFSGKVTTLGMATSALLVPIATAIGMALGADGALSIAIGFLILVLGGLASAAGPTAAAHGVFASFAYLIGIGLASTATSGLVVFLALLVGGIYAVAISIVLRIVGISAFPPPPDIGTAHRAGTELVAELTTWNATTRRALALGVVGVVGLAITPFVQDSNGAWLITAGLIVLKPDLRSTIDTATARGLGTVAGALIAGAIAALTSNPWVLLVAAFVLTWWAEALIRRSYGAFSVLITPLAVLLADIASPSGWDLAILRAADVAVGSVLGVVVGLILLARPQETDEQARPD